MSRGQMLILASLVAVVAALFLVRGHLDKRPADSPDPSRSVVATVSTPQPFDPAKAMATARRLLADAPSSAPSPDPIEPGRAYAALSVTPSTPLTITPFLAQVFGNESDLGRDHGGFAVIASVTGADGRTVSVAPLAVVRPDHQGAAPILASGPITRFIDAEILDGARVTIELVEIAQGMDRLEKWARTILAELAGSNDPASAHFAPPPAMGSFVDALSRAARHRLPAATALSLSLAEGARTLEFGDDGGISFALVGRPPLLNTVADTPEAHLAWAIARVEKAPARTVAMWTAGQEELARACAVLGEFLSDREGLSRADRDAVMVALLARRAMFDERGDDAFTACLGATEAEARAALGLTPPSSPPAAQPTDRMNRTLTELARAVRVSDPEAAALGATRMFAGHVLIEDAFGVAAAVAGSTALVGRQTVVAPRAPAEAAAHYVAALPLRNVGCYHTGVGAGPHRSTLLQLVGDPSLWLMNLAFDETGKVAGVRTRPATQGDLCRAIAGRAPEDMCLHGRPGRSYPGGISSDNCR